MPTQTEAGKAFEYALLKQSYEILASANVSIKKDNAYITAHNCFDLFSYIEQKEYLKAAEVAIKHIVELEPYLSAALSDEELILQIVPDKQGLQGDVRDVLFIRSTHGWEIGISAKNNHEAVKHSRLSETIDFGKKWLGFNCSDEYFDDIKPVFEELKFLKEKNQLWRELNDKQKRFYVPVLTAFKDELLRLDCQYTQFVPGKLLEYLIGNKDFYKVIKRKEITEVYGFNLHGTLNKYAGSEKSKFKVPVLKLPTQIIDLSFKKNSSDTLMLICNEGWQISFRIHNASSRIEPSLKFDINLVGQPRSLYSHHITWNI